MSHKLLYRNLRFPCELRIHFRSLIASLLLSCGLLAVANEPAIAQIRVQPTERDDDSKHKTQNDLPAGIECVYIERTRRSWAWRSGMHNTTLRMFGDRILMELRNGSLIAVKTSELVPIDLGKIPDTHSNEDWQSNPLKKLVRGTQVGVRKDMTLFFTNDEVWTLSPHSHIDVEDESTFHALHSQWDFNIANFKIQRLNAEETETLLGKSTRNHCQFGFCHFMVPGIERVAFQSRTSPFEQELPNEPRIFAGTNNLIGPRDLLPPFQLRITDVDSASLVGTEKFVLVPIDEQGQQQWVLHTIVGNEAILSGPTETSGFVKYIAIDLDDSSLREIYTHQRSLHPKWETYRLNRNRMRGLEPAIHQESMYVNEVVNGKHVIRQINLLDSSVSKTIDPPEGWNVGYTISIDSAGRLISTLYRPATDQERDISGFESIPGYMLVDPGSSTGRLVGEVPVEIMATAEMLKLNAWRSQLVKTQRNHFQFVFDSQYVYFVGALPGRLICPPDFPFDRKHQHRGNFAIYRMPLRPR